MLNERTARASGEQEQDSSDVIALRQPPDGNGDHPWRGSARARNGGTAAATTQNGTATHEKGKKPLRILMELRPGFEGFAGIPQETRLLFAAFRKMNGVDAVGLINHPS